MEIHPMRVIVRRTTLLLATSLLVLANPDSIAGQLGWQGPHESDAAHHACKLVLAEEFPGFGGYFWNPGQWFFVSVMEASDNAIREALLPYAGVAEVTVVRGKYDYSELAHLRDEVEHLLREMNPPADVVIDDERNLVKVRLADDQRRSVLTILGGSSIPADVVRLESKNEAWFDDLPLTEAALNDPNFDRDAYMTPPGVPCEQ